MTTVQGLALEREMRAAYRQNAVQDALTLVALAVIITGLFLLTAPDSPHGAEAGVSSLAPASPIQE